jgi:hypothetical protein
MRAHVKMMMMWGAQMRGEAMLRARAKRWRRRRRRLLLRVVVAYYHRKVNMRTQNRLLEIQ